jgi:YHS domain-containing protein
VTKNGKDAPLKCYTCLKQLPKSAACSFEGEEYVWYFCGASCYEQWRSQTKQWLSEKEPVKKFSKKLLSNKK